MYSSLTQLANKEVVIAKRGLQKDKTEALFGYDYNSQTPLSSRAVRNQGAKSSKETIMKYNELTFGQMEAIVNKLGGMEGVRRFLCGELSLNVPQFAVWKTIKIGLHKKLAAITTMPTKFRVSDWAKKILGKPAFTLAQVEEDISLCVATVKELTGKDRATTTEVFNAIKLVGDLCPAEVGPALREQYLDQPDGELLFIAMEPIKDYIGRLNVFRVEHDNDELGLDGNYANPAGVWDGDHRFVFRSRK